MVFHCNFIFAIACVFLKLMAGVVTGRGKSIIGSLMTLLIKGRSDDARCRPVRGMKMIKWKAIGVG
jgi:hypothetical protein